MFKIKRLFNSLILSFTVIGILCIGLLLPKNDKQVSLAEPPTYQQIVNNNPEYFIALPSEDMAGSVGDTIYLMQGGDGGSRVSVAIAAFDKIENTASATENVNELNYAYITDSTANTENDTQEYYYFTFTNSLSLYYNLSNSQVQAGQVGTNLLYGQDITNYASSNTDDGEMAFTIPGLGITPQKLEVNFTLDTNLEEVGLSGNRITLNQEGIYTLVINVNYFYTNNGGLTFTPGTQTIYYSFMVFSSNTYFNNTTGLPNITPSSNIQQTSLTSSDTFSRYYYYNYSFAGDTVISTNSLASFSYDPDKYQITVSYTDINQISYTATVVYNNGILSQVDENGVEINEANYFVFPYISDGQCNLIFLDIGYYDLSFQYLYKANFDGIESVFELPFADSLDTTTLQNESQRLYIYGYQAVYSDYANINIDTNQPEEVELKTFDFDQLSYFASADITSAVNNYIISNPGSVGSETDTNVENPGAHASETSPSSYRVFSNNQLRNAALTYLNNGNQAGLIEPVSTNQTPIKFLTNSTNSIDNSYIYSLSTTEIDGKLQYDIVNTANFEGFNQNEPGLYLYVIQYQFENYMSTSGTLQSSYYHYQIFFFEITNTTPSVTVLDSDFDEVYASGYTNKSVYILNDTENNIYDAQVSITLSAYNYANNSYFFQNQDITNLSNYGITYRQFEEATAETENYEEYNENIAGKYGILIENTSIYANAQFTIQILSANSTVPSSRTFTIDTNEISGVTARNVTYSSSTTYRINDSISSYNTNRPLIFSWNEKASGAATYGYVKYIPLNEINYYSSQTNSATVSQLLDYWIAQGSLPVSYKLDLNQASSWTEYRNSASFNSTIDVTYVKSNSGFYILELYDQAGNSTFEIYMLDNTSPIFVLRVSYNDETRQVMTNSQSISVPETGTRMWVEWSDSKSIYIDNIDSYSSITPYTFTLGYNEASANLNELLSNFFSNSTNSDIKRVTNISISAITSGSEEGQITTGISSYNGSYLVIDIDDVSYIREITSNYNRYTGINNYEIDFIDDDGQAREGTYRILIRDMSNTYVTGNEQNDFLNNPSAILTFNVTSDDSKLSVYRGSGENQTMLDWASYDLTGNLYYYEDEYGENIYTHLTEMQGVDLTQSDLTFRFAYYIPVNADEELTISFIPLADNGSTLGSVVLRYYPYEKTYQLIDGKYYYYYDISDEEQRVVIYEYDTSVSYQPGEILTYTVALGSGNLPGAGRYIIERQYVEGNETDQYDYFKRTITFDVDDFGLISGLEAVSGGGNSALESIVGGDIILSMYSSEGNSSIQVSFPSYSDETGLNNGSFYTKESFSSEDEIPTFSVEGNKLPMTLYIPKYKFTLTTSYDETSNSYSVNYNNNLSYYGNTYYQLEEDNLWHVYSEGIEVTEPFDSESEASDYVNSLASIAEYEIFAKVVAEVLENGRNVTKYYYSNGTTTGGFLNLYEGTSNGIITNSTPVDFFFEQGSYVVTIYQSNNDPQSTFYSYYKFGFEIISQQPTFSIVNADGYELSSVSTNTYYTNSNSLTIQWEVPTSEFEARINEDFSHITINGSQAVTHSEITANGNTRYFTIDCSNLIASVNSSLTITMEFEGHSDSYYSRTTKTIYFDRSAPLQNLQNLMTNTEYATSNMFTRNYQELNMRSYQDYQGQDVNITAENYNQIQNMSYSFSASTGYFQYYSYNVTTDFFNTTLVETLRNAPNFRYDTQYIYYEEVPSLDSYTQVDRNSFSANNYYQLTTDGVNDLGCGYYEIVEMDYAGNMVVYLVYLIDSFFEDDENVNENALTYTNAQHSEEINVLSEDITDGFNIYSNSGFELQSLSYMSDPWSLVYIQISGQSFIRYMTSPWLEDGYIYRITVNSTGVNFEQVTLASIFDNVESSSNKHTITFTDRINGSSYNAYLSIMDATITTQKVEDPNRTSAILNISVPTQAQYESTTTSFVFPTQISISQYNSTTGEYDMLMLANQAPYGTWTPTEEFETALSYISFTTINNGSTLQIVISLGANASQKVRFEILDNFGNETTIIQLANEVAYNEISGESNIYEITESNGDITYLSDDTINFAYNTLLYTINIYNLDNVDITGNLTYTNLGNNIHSYPLSPSRANIYDDYYRIVVTDSETNEEIRTLHIRIYNQLPYLAYSTNEIYDGAIVFVDKNLIPLESGDFATIPNYTVTFDGVPYTAIAQAATTYSQTVRLRFRDGQALNYEGANSYQDGYGYSVYLSSDNGNTWLNINDDYSASSGYTISGTGEYIILIKYDSQTLFTDLCRIFTLSILDSSTSYYYITVDGMPVERGSMKYTDTYGYEYDVNYIVSVDYADRNNRLQIVSNEELGVEISVPRVETTGTNVYVEIYHYECDESRGDFTIIYINETNNILTQFTYETTSGTTESIRSSPSVVIVANNETESSFDRLKLNFNSYYGIEQNIINVEVLKFFNGSYTTITPTIYSTNNDMSYIYLEKAGSYRVRLYDSCSPANVHLFGNSTYIDIVFLNSVPFTVTYLDTISGEEVTSERVDNAVYNSDVILSLYNLSSYYQASGYPSISVRLNGNTYTDYTVNNYNYTFTQPGYYSIVFTSTSTTGISIRQDEYNFTIINENESRYAYEFIQYKNYYIERVIKDGIDITQDLIDIGNYDTIRINGVTYLSELLMNYLDEKTGSGRYQITVNTNDSAYANTSSSKYTFEFWLNMQNPPLNISLDEGESTTGTITITFNVQNFYNAMGDCYIRIGSQYHYFTADRLANYGETYTINIENTGTYFIQVYTMSNNLLYSYKVIRSEPLNTFAIIAIIIGVIAVAAVVGITIALRKKQKVK